MRIGLLRLRDPPWPDETVAAARRTKGRRCSRPEHRAGRGRDIRDRDPAPRSTAGKAPRRSFRTSGGSAGKEIAQPSSTRSPTTSGASRRARGPGAPPLHWSEAERCTRSSTSREGIGERGGDVSGSNTPCGGGAPARAYGKTTRRSCWTPWTNCLTSRLSRRGIGSRCVRIRLLGNCGWETFVYTMTWITNGSGRPHPGRGSQEAAQGSHRKR
jgi:hypothetical protein